MAKVRVGRFWLTESEFREFTDTPSDTGGRLVKMTGVELSPYLTESAIRALQSDIVNSALKMVPVRFQNKSEWNGYYRVNACEAKLTDWKTEGVAKLEWSFDLERIGGSDEIDIQANMAGTRYLINDFFSDGERWHAPPIGHQAYWSGGTTPSQVTRNTAEGPIVVYRQIPEGVSPRYNCPVELYPLGRVRFLDDSGNERTGTKFSCGVEGWSLENALVRVTQDEDGVFLVSAYDGQSWDTIEWALSAFSTEMGTPVSVTLLKNEFEVVTVRLLWNVSTSGRVQADLTLRRGARHVEFYIKSHASTTISLDRTSTEAATTDTGFIVATSDDADGNKFVIGSAKEFTEDLTNGGVGKAATLVLDLFVGAAVGGASAVDGDDPTDLFEQYIGAPAERILGVRL